LGFFSSKKAKKNKTLVLSKDLVHQFVEEVIRKSLQDLEIPSSETFEFVDQCKSYFDNKEIASHPKFSSRAKGLQKYIDSNMSQEYIKFELNLKDFLVTKDLDETERHLKLLELAK